MSDALKDLSKTVVYTYTASAVLEPPGSYEDAARQAIYAAHGYIPKPYEEAPRAVKDAISMLAAAQGALVTIDVYADGRRRIRNAHR